MKTAALQHLRAKLAADLPVYGLWVTLESPSITEMAVALGVDWVVVDAEHGHLDWKEIIEHVRAAVRSNTVVLVRVAEHSIGLIKRVLDIGADGVVVPWVESAEQLRAVVSFAQFPPEGVRGIGAERATCWGQCLVQHTQDANEHVLIVPVIESVKGGRNIHVDAASGRSRPLSSSDPPTTPLRPAIGDSGKVREWPRNCWRSRTRFAAPASTWGSLRRATRDLLERARQGFRMLALGVDSGLLLRSLHGAGDGRP